MSPLQTQVKALIAAAVGFGTMWAAQRFGIKIDQPEIQAAIVGVILHQMTYWFPNAPTA